MIPFLLKDLRAFVDATETKLPSWYYSLEKIKSSGGDISLRITFSPSKYCLDKESLSLLNIHLAGIEILDLSSDISNHRTFVFDFNDSDCSRILNNPSYMFEVIDKAKLTCASVKDIRPIDVERECFSISRLDDPSLIPYISVNPEEDNFLTYLAVKVYSEYSLGKITRVISWTHK